MEWVVWKWHNISECLLWSFTPIQLQFWKCFCQSWIVSHVRGSPSFKCIDWQVQSGQNHKIKREDLLSRIRFSFGGRRRKLKSFFCMRRSSREVFFRPEAQNFNIRSRLAIFRIPLCRLNRAKNRAKHYYYHHGDSFFPEGITEVTTATAIILLIISCGK